MDNTQIAIGTKVMVTRTGDEGVVTEVFENRMVGYIKVQFDTFTSTMPARFFTGECISGMKRGKILEA